MKLPYQLPSETLKAIFVQKQKLIDEQRHYMFKQIILECQASTQSKNGHPKKD